MMIIRKTEIISVGEDVEKLEATSVAGGNVKWVSHCERTVWLFLKKVNIELPYDTAIPLPDKSLKELKTDTQVHVYECS